MLSLLLNRSMPSLLSLSACRIATYDDIIVQFNKSARNLTSHELPPYRRNVTAKLQYGHAAVIVGYDNADYTWTILNSCKGCIDWCGCG
jgi:hypothetical protein